MDKMILFFSGAFFANAIPHFIHGISGENFHNPFLHRFIPGVPSPLFNVIWGLLFFFLSLWLLSLKKNFNIGFNWESYLFGIGFVFASIMCSLFFGKGGWSG